MTFSIKTLTIMCACAVLALAIIANAQSDSNANVNTEINVTTDAGSGSSVEYNIETRIGASTTKQKGIFKGGMPIRRAFHATETRIQDNKDVRNQMLRNEQGLRVERQGNRAEFQNHAQEMREGMKDDRKEFRAPTTMNKDDFKARMGAGREKMKSMRKALAVELHGNRGAQLTNATKILDNAEARIKSIADKQKENGKDVTDALAKLALAHTAIVKAKADVQAFVSWKPAEGQANASTTVEAEVDITRPRQLFEAAKKSIFEARDALRKAAMALGLGDEREGTHATTTASTTISVTSTTTASTSDQN